MTNQDSIVQLTALKGQHENDAAAIGAALAILKNGYQSDQEFIREQIESGVAAGIASAVAEATSPLNEQITELETQLAPSVEEEEDVT